MFSTALKIPKFPFSALYNVYIKRKLGLWTPQKCIPFVGAISALTCAGPQTTPTLGRQYRDENGILGKSGATFRHGAVFEPKH